MCVCMRVYLFVMSELTSMHDLMTTKSERPEKKASKAVRMLGYCLFDDIDPEFIECVCTDYLWFEVLGSTHTM